MVAGLADFFTVRLVAGAGLTEPVLAGIALVAGLADLSMVLFVAGAGLIETVLAGVALVEGAVLVPSLCTSLVTFLVDSFTAVFSTLFNASFFVCARTLPVIPIENSAVMVIKSVFFIFIGLVYPMLVNYCTNTNSG